jgi:hypothetical protein
MLVWAELIRPTVFLTHELLVKLTVGLNLDEQPRWG